MYCDSVPTVMLVPPVKVLSVLLPPFCALFVTPASVVRVTTPLVSLYSVT